MALAAPIDDMFTAASDGDANSVRALLAHGVDVNAKTSVSGGSTALMVASFGGHSEVVQVLLDKGADVNAKNDDGYSALMMAAQQGQSEVVRILLDKGAEVNAKTNDGMTSLILASMNSHRDVVEELLAKGADVNARTNDGRTALVAATDASIRALLTQAGTQPNENSTPPTAIEKSANESASSITHQTNCGEPGKGGTAESYIAFHKKHPNSGMIVVRTGAIKWGGGMHREGRGYVLDDVAIGNSDVSVTVQEALILGLARTEGSTIQGVPDFGIADAIVVFKNKKVVACQIR
jgi:hypothetical protein